MTGVVPSAVWRSEIHSKRQDSWATSWQAHGERHSSLGGESMPSSVRQIQQCRGSGSSIFGCAPACGCVSDGAGSEGEGEKGSTVEPATASMEESAEEVLGDGMAAGEDGSEWSTRRAEEKIWLFRGCSEEELLERGGGGLSEFESMSTLDYSS